MNDRTGDGTRPRPPRSLRSSTPRGKGVKFQTGRTGDTRDARGNDPRPVKRARLTLDGPRNFTKSRKPLSPANLAPDPRTESRTGLRLDSKLPLGDFRDSGNWAVPSKRQPTPPPPPQGRPQQRATISARSVALHILESGFMPGQLPAGRSVAIPRDLRSDVAPPPEFLGIGGKGTVEVGSPSGDTGRSVLGAYLSLDPRDKALAWRLGAIGLRRRGTLAEVLKAHVQLPKDDLIPIFQLCLAQVLWFRLPTYAVISTGMELLASRNQSRYRKLLHGVIGKLARMEPDMVLAGLDPAQCDLSERLRTALQARAKDQFPEALAQLLREAPLDLTPVGLSADALAELLEESNERPVDRQKTNGAWDATQHTQSKSLRVLPTGTVRMTGQSHPNHLQPFLDGFAFVQDAAARLPVLALGNVKGKQVLDLCAAPGGKAFAVADLGAEVLAIDSSPERLELMRQEALRLNLTLQLHEGDGTTLDLERKEEVPTLPKADQAWDPQEATEARQQKLDEELAQKQAQKLARDGVKKIGFMRFDAVLVDAPCSGSGVGRKRPDRLAREISDRELAALCGIQDRLLQSAASRLRPGGRLVYSVCSLDPQEGENRIEAFLSTSTQFEIDPLGPEFLPELPGECFEDGYVKTHPGVWSEWGGMDGFFVARLKAKE